MHKSKQDYMRGVIAAKYNEVHEPSVSGHVWCGDKAIRDYYERIDSMAREFAKPFYNSERWKYVRRQILRRDGYECAHCKGRANEVHHIIELTPDNINDDNVSVNPENLLSLCRDCHSKITKARAGDVGEEFKFDESGQVIRRSPPGSNRF